MNVNPTLSGKVEGNPIIWRYIDLTKFLDMICNKRLHFANPLKFKDPFELSLPRLDKNKQYMTTVIDYFKKHGASSGYISNICKKGTRTDIDVCCAIAHHSYVNCWHIKEHESAAMWDIYSKESGIAIH